MIAIAFPQLLKKIGEDEDLTNRIELESVFHTLYFGSGFYKVPIYKNTMIYSYLCFSYNSWNLCDYLFFL